MSSDAGLLRPGAIVAGKYRVERLLGRGGMGSVYAARDTHLDRPVALKVLHADLGDQPEHLVRFEREARLLARVTHPHIVALYDVGRHDGAAFLVMELMEGPSLEEVLRAQGPLPLPDALRFARHIAAGLAEAHVVGVVHRDVKADNILLRRQANGSFVAKVADFGIARTYEVTPGGLEATAAGVLVGTPTSMAPEQIRGEALDGRADAYALAVLLYRMLTGVSPFRRESAAASLIAHLVDPPPPLALPAGATVPLALQQELSRGLAKRPEDRHPDITAFVDALEMAAGLHGAEASHTQAEHACCACGSAMPAAAAFCQRCGAPSLMAGCPSCGTTREGPRSRCVACGESLLSPPSRHGLGRSPRGQGEASGGFSLEFAVALAMSLPGELALHGDLDDIIDTFLAVVSREGGRPLALLGREAIAVFGLGGCSQRETELAVDTALSLCAALDAPLRRRGVHTRASVGVESGLVLAPPTGVCLGMAFAAGEGVEGARQAAQRRVESGGVGIGPRAYLDIRSVYITTKLDGKFRAVDRRRAVLFTDSLAARERRPMVGRDHAVQALLKAARRVERGRRAQLVVVAGEAGSGKSRLLAELLRELEEAPGWWFADVGRCGAARLAVPYEPFQRMLRARFRVEPGDRLDELPQAMRRFLLEREGSGDPAAGLDEQVRALVELFAPPRREPQTAATPAPAAAETRRLAYAGYRRYLHAAAARSPVIVVLDDAHEATEASVDLLVWLAEHLLDAPILFVVAGNGAEDDAQQGWLKALHGAPLQVTTLVLSALDEDDAMAMAETRFPGIALAPQDLSALVSSTLGRPAAIEQALDLLEDDGTIARTAGGWTVTSAAKLHQALTRSHQAALEARLGALDTTAATVLAAIACAGADAVPRGMIAAMVPELQLEAPLSALKYAGLLLERRQSALAPEREFSLRRRESASLALPTPEPSRVAAWHSAAADWLARWDGPPVPGQSAWRAWHLGQAGRSVEAADQHLSAAAAAIHILARREAWHHFRAAVQELDRARADSAAQGAASADPDDDVNAWMTCALLGVAEVGCQLGELDSAIAAADRVLAGPPAPPAAARCRALAIRGDIHELRGDNRRAIRDYHEAAQGAAQDSGMVWLAVHAASRQSLILFKIGRKSDATSLATVALSRWGQREGMALAGALGRLELVLGHIASQDGDGAAATDHYRASARHFSAASDPIGATMVELSIANVAFRAGQLADAEGCYRAVAARCVELDHLHGRLMAETNLGNVLLDMGRHDEAVTVLEAAERLARGSGVMATLPETLRLLGAVHAARGDAVRAACYAAEAKSRSAALVGK